MLVSMTKPKFYLLFKKRNQQKTPNSLNHSSGKKRWKVLGQKEDLNAKDGLGHYIERF